MASLLFLYESIELVSYTTIPGVCFGIIISIYFLCIQLFYRQYRKAPDERMKTVFSFFYNSLMVFMVLLELGGNLKFIQLIYIDHGGVNGETLDFQNDLESGFSAIWLIETLPGFVIGTLSPLMQIWRTWIIWATSPYRFMATIPPLFLAISGLSLDIYAGVLSASGTQVNTQNVLNIVLGALNVAFNVSVTLLLVGRIIIGRMRNVRLMVMTQAEPRAYAQWIRELIVWSHSSHRNVLPFYGMYFDESNRICLVSPFMKNGNLHDYAPRLPQKDRMPLLSDVIKGLDYLHGISIVHSDLKGQNVLISDEGRALITDFGASHVTTSTAIGQATDSPISKSLCFAAPEMITNADARPTKECDIWSFGCLCYAVLSRKSPYYECTRDYQITAALARGDPPKRPGKVNQNLEENDPWEDIEDKDWDDIDDSAWSLITKCCKPKPEDRLTAIGIQELIANMKIWDGRPEAKGVPGSGILKLGSTPDIDLKRVGELLEKIQVALLMPKTQSVIFRDSPQDIAAIMAELDDREKTSALTDFLDRILVDHLLEERDYVLNLLSSVSGSTRNLPGRYKLEGVQYKPEPINREESVGKVHQGLNTNLCVKVLPRARSGLDLPSGYRYWLKMIAIWPYLLHPNILPFYGLYSEINYEPGYNCIVLPYLQNGNLIEYAYSLPQQNRLPMLCDIIEGLDYLHGLGFAHINLKPENILISDEGRALITDLGGSPVAEGESANTALTRTLRYTAPELVKNRLAQPTRESDIWSFGCICYELLSRKAPYYQYTKISDIQSALARGEIPRRLRPSNGGTDVINDQFWILISDCCKTAPEHRLKSSKVLGLLKKLQIQDNRPEAKALPGAEVLKLRPKPAIDIDLVEEVLEEIQTRLSLAFWQEEGEEVKQD